MTAKAWIKGGKLLLDPAGKAYVCDPDDGQFPPCCKHEIVGVCPWCIDGIFPAQVGFSFAGILNGDCLACDLINKDWVLDHCVNVLGQPGCFWYSKTGRIDLGGGFVGCGPDAGFVFQYENAFVLGQYRATLDFGPIGNLSDLSICVGPGPSLVHYVSDNIIGLPDCLQPIELTFDLGSAASSCDRFSWPEHLTVAPA